MKKPAAARFDAGYYRRHYLNPRTAVSSPPEMARRATFIGGFLNHAGLRVQRILDAGCGLGWMRKPLLKQFPKARYTGLDVSAYLCEKYGWINESIGRFKPKSPFDLVVCNDVLQYLDDREAELAMRNFARLAHGALYFSALTQQDWDYHCNRRLTDRKVHLRPAEWYLSRLAGPGRHPRFTPLGGGLFLSRGVDVQLWELERVVHSGKSSL